MNISKQTRKIVFKAGYAAKGLVYLLIGLFAIGALVGLSRDASGPKEVIAWLGKNVGGFLILITIGVGLACYCLWRYYRALRPEASAEDSSISAVKRIGWAVSGTIYGTFSVFAFRKALAGKGSTGGKEEMLADILANSWGEAVVWVLAILIFGTGLHQLYKAFTDKHMEDIHGLSKDQKEVFRNAGRLGLSARAVVYGIIAYFLYRAATLSDADKMRGIEESLAYLETGWGTAVLAVVGAGLLAYGFFMLVRARYESV